MVFQSARFRTQLRQTSLSPSHCNLRCKYVSVKHICHIAFDNSGSIRTPADYLNECSREIVVQPKLLSNTIHERTKKVYKYISMNFGSNHANRCSKQFSVMLTRNSVCSRRMSEIRIQIMSHAFISALDRIICISVVL